MRRVIVRTLRIVLPLAVLGGAGLAAVAMIRNRPPVETQPPVFEPPGVRVEEVVLRDVTLSVTSQGTVRPRTESQLVPEIAGRVTWVAPSFAEGGFFESGDVLVKIDPFDYQQAIVSTRSQLAQARLRLAQEEAEAEVALREWAELGRGNPRALTLREPQLDDARASVAAAEANVVRAERDLERAEIVAPYAGRIRQKNVDIGQFVRVGDAVATVYAVDIAEVRLPLPDEQLAYLDLPLSYRGGSDQPQPRVTLRATFAGEAHEWQGRIVRTESEIDPVSRMVHVVAEVSDPYAPGPHSNRPPLAVGMYVEAEIAGRTVRDVAVVPRTALRGRAQVLVVGPDDRLYFRDIDILRTTTESVFARDGLAEGELVAVSSLDAPTDGMRVQLADADPELLARRRSGPPVSPTPAPGASAQASPVVAEASVAPARPVATVAAVPDAVLENDPPAPDPSGDEPERPSWLSDLIASENRDTPARADRAEPAPAPSGGRLARAAPAPATPPGARGGTEPALDAAPQRAPERLVRARPSPDAIRSLAVLPFDDLGASGHDPAAVDLGRVITDTVAARLADLSVVTIMTPDEGATWVVGGGIQRVGGMVRVTARVIDTASGAVIKAIKVDGTLEDLAELQDRVAAAVSQGVEDALADRVDVGADGTHTAGDGRWS